MERPDLADELKRLADEDLAVRQRLADSGELFGGYHPDMAVIHRRNGDRLTAILDEVGSWPGRQLVGEEGSWAAFLIGQHDIANPALIRRCRDLYEVAVKRADAEPSQLAYFEDRIRYFEGRPQLYGTQLGWNDDGEFGSWPPVEEPETVDERRRQIGLPPLDEVIATALAGRPSRPPMNEILIEHRKANQFAQRVGWRTD